MKKEKKSIWNNSKFRKVRDIILFISLGFNLLIAILFSVVGCSVRQYDNTNDQLKQPETQLVHTRKQLTGFDMYSNNSCIGFDLNNLIVNETIWDYSPDTDYIDLYNINGYVMLQKAGNSEVLENVNQLTIDISNDHLYMRKNGAQSFECAWVKSPTTKVWALSFNGMANKLFINYNQSDEYNWYFSILSNFFAEVSYQEYDLSQNWNPYGYFNSNDGIISNFTNATTVTILDNAAFSINGRFYNRINIYLANAVGSGWLDNEGNYFVNQQPGTYIMLVTAVNTLTNTDVSLCRSTSKLITNGNSQTYANVPGKLTIDDYSNLHIRLFDYNLDQITYLSFTNGNALDLKTSYAFDSGTVLTGNVISLLSTAFDGFKNIFGITILPGLSIGVLLFLPLVVSIIVLVFKAVKK